MVLLLVQNRKGLHKISLPWEGPFVVSKALLNGSYYLVDIKDGYRKVQGKKRKRRVDDKYDETKRPWNIEQLRDFYT